MNTTTVTWPELPFDAWADTYETLHMWMQVVGKIKLALAPPLNEWWEVAFTMTAHGLTTGPIPFGERLFEIEFDFIEHQVHIRVSDGHSRNILLIPRSVATFYELLMDELEELGLDCTIHTQPVECEIVTPYPEDHSHHSYDREYASRWWRILVQLERLLQTYRSDFLGKSSPILFFWGSFDMAHTRYAGRLTTMPEGANHMRRVGGDEEQFEVGFWPGSGKLKAPAFFAYCLPRPDGAKEAAIQPATASYNGDLDEFILLYDDARNAASPDEAILSFFRSTYDACATLAGWDRAFLERKIR